MAPLPASTRRMRWLKVSEKNRLPALSNATSNGPFNNAASAGPPSPAKPFSPVPTAVAITYFAMPMPPVSGIRLNPNSADFHHRDTEARRQPLAVIASEAKQSPADRDTSEGDCIVAALLAMTAFFGSQASRPQGGPEARGPSFLPLCPPCLCGDSLLRLRGARPWGSNAVRHPETGRMDMSDGKKPRLIGINHVAIEVGDIDEALDGYGKIFDFNLRGRSERSAFIDMGDQFINMARVADYKQSGVERRHIGFVVDDRASVKGRAQAGRA